MSIECSTCVEPLMANGDNSTTLCGHVFHTDCINRWFQKGQSNCPQCRNATTINGLIKTHFSEAEEDIDRNAAGDALEADLKCIELAEKNENLQKGMKVELVSKELNHLEAILHVYAGGLNFMK